MPAAFNGDVTLTVEIGFDSDPTVAIGSTIWTDVTADVRQDPGILTETGRQHELDRFESGTVTLTLDDRDRDYDPFNSAGPHFGKLLPHRRIRITATHDLTAFDVFNGFVESFKPGLSLSGDQVSNLTCYDGLKVLARSTLSNDELYSDLVLADSPVAYYRLDDQQGSLTAVDASGNGNNAQYRGDPFLQRTGALQADPNPAVSLADPEGELEFGVTTPGEDVATAFMSLPDTVWPDNTDRTVEFWMLVRSVISVGADRVLDVDDQLNEGGFFIEVEDPNEASGTFEVQMFAFQSSPNLVTSRTITGVTFNAWHHVAVVNSADNWTIFVDGVSETGATAIDVGTALVNHTVGAFRFEQSPTLNATIDELAFYPSALSSADIDARIAVGRPLLAQRTDERIGLVLDLAEWPAADRDLEVGDSDVRRKDDNDLTDVNSLTHARLVEDTEAGGLYVLPNGQFRFRNRQAFSKDPVHLNVQATFDMFGGVGTLPYAALELSLDDVLIRNTVTVTPGDGDPQTAIDLPSRAQFYVQSFERDTELTSSAVSEALQHAHLILNNHKDANGRIDAIVIDPNAQPDDLWPEVLGRQLEDRVRVIFRPETGPIIDQELLVQRIIHEIIGRTWRTTYQLGQTGEQETFWLIGVEGRSEIGETTVVGF